MAKVFRKKIIYDYDDAIWMLETSAENKLAKLFKAAWKVKYICKWSYKVVGGNEYLCEYARPYNNNVFLIPTCVDTARHHKYQKQHTNNKKVVVGWTGSHTTLVYLEPLVPVIQKLQAELDFNFTIICNRDPKWDIKDYSFVKWNGDTEVEDLFKLDAGVMPLVDDKWTEGKCGFKLIQYMSLGIPAVASPAGVNKIIVDHGENGFLATEPGEWEQYLRELIVDADLRQKMGSAGRQKIVNEYSIPSQAQKFINLFN